MNIYIQLLLAASVTDYIVGVSGFTTSWRTGVARLLKTEERNLRELKPFDCPACMTWWVCIVYTICAGTFSLPAVAACAALSLLSFPMCQTMIFIREGLNKVIDLMMVWL